MMKAGQRTNSNLSKTINCYYLDSHTCSSNSVGFIRKLRRLPNKNQQIVKINCQTRNLQQKMKNISGSIMAQKKNLHKNLQSLLQKIKQYYIKINEKLQVQRTQVQRSLQAEFKKAQKKLDQHNKKMDIFKKDLNYNRKQRNYDAICEQIEFVEIPTISFNEAQFQSLDFVLALLHPMIEYSQNCKVYNTKANKKLFSQKQLIPPFSLGKVQDVKQNQQKQMRQINAFKKNSRAQLDETQQDIKTVIKGKNDNFLFCQEQINEWKHQSLKGKKSVGVQQVIIEQSQSKQSSLLSQQML